MWRGSDLRQVPPHSRPLRAGELSKTTSTLPQSAVQGEQRDQLRVRLGELNMRTSTEPLDHLDKPIIELRMHKNFDNLTKEFDIALIKFDMEGIEFQVARYYTDNYQLFPSSLTSGPSACPPQTLTWRAPWPGSLGGGRCTRGGGSCPTVSGRWRSQVNSTITHYYNYYY